MAPFAPFSSDAMYRNLSNGESCAPERLPEARRIRMAPVRPTWRARAGGGGGLAARDAAADEGPGSRLSSIALPGDPLPRDIAQIVREELNVQGAGLRCAGVKLNTEITEELGSRGWPARSCVRSRTAARGRLERRGPHPHPI